MAHPEVTRRFQARKEIADRVRQCRASESFDRKLVRRIYRDCLKREVVAKPTRASLQAEALANWWVILDKSDCPRICGLDDAWLERQYDYQEYAAELVEASLDPRLSRGGVS